MTTLFDDLMQSVTEMDDIVRGERQPSREFQIDALQIKQIRKATGLSQAQFARKINIDVGTLRNWEQSRREPTGPAKALLIALKNDPQHVLAALGAQD